MRISEFVKRTISSGPRYAFSFFLWRIKWVFCRTLKLEKITSRYGIALHSNYSDATFRFYFCGSYGEFYSEFLKTIDTNFSFIDVGANQGLYAIIGAKNSNCSNTICFEPIAETFALLVKNIELNQVGHKCTAFNFAIDNASGEKQIAFNDEHSGATSLAASTEMAASYQTIRTIDRTTLDDLFFKLNGELILKVDVEGYEMTVLSEILKCERAPSISSIFYEVNTSWLDPNEIKELLRNNGFAKFEKIGRGDIHYDVFATR